MSSSAAALPHAERLGPDSRQVALAEGYGPNSAASAAAHHCAPGKSAACPPSFLLRLRFESSLSVTYWERHPTPESRVCILSWRDRCGVRHMGDMREREMCSVLSHGSRSRTVANRSVLPRRDSFLSSFLGPAAAPRCRDDAAAPGAGEAPEAIANSLLNTLPYHLSTP